MKTQNNKTTAHKQPKQTAVQHQRRPKPSAAATKPITGRPAARSTKPTDVASRTSSKLAAVIEMLKRRDGATINDLSKATGWQTHSVRGLLSGTIKRKLGLKLRSGKTDGVRTYRIDA
jgi:Ni,Fe-hydrogenase I large subunit